MGNQPSKTSFYDGQPTENGPRLRQWSASSGSMTSSDSESASSTQAAAAAAYPRRSSLQHPPPYHKLSHQRQVSLQQRYSMDRFIVPEVEKNTGSQQYRWQTRRVLRRNTSCEIDFCWMDGRSHIRMRDACSIMPIDTMETERYGLYHRIVKHVLGGNCPLVTELDMSRVLDVGTGDGTWLMEMAADHPNVDFVGCDIVDMTSHAPMSNNCRWEYGNILHKLPHDDNSFDLIHQRQLGCYITEKQWPSVARELYRLCRPGGRVVLVEIELSMNTQVAVAEAISNPNTIDAANKDALVQLNTILTNALQQSGVNPDAIRHLDQLLKCVGFVGVYRETIPIPCGSWGGQIGRAMMRHLQMTMTAGTATAMATDRASRVEYDALVEMAGSLLGSNQSYHNLHVFVAEKPLTSSDHHRTGSNGGNNRLSLLRREVIDGVQRIGAIRR